MTQDHDNAEIQAWHTMGLWDRYNRRLERLYDPDVPIAESDRRCIKLMLKVHDLLRLMAYEEMVTHDPVVPDEMFGESWQVHDHYRWPAYALGSKAPQVAEALRALEEAIRATAAQPEPSADTTPPEPHPNRDVLARFLRPPSSDESMPPDAPDAPTAPS